MALNTVSKWTIVYTHWILFSPKINHEAKQSKQAHVHVDIINSKSDLRIHIIVIVYADIVQMNANMPIICAKQSNKVYKKWYTFTNYFFSQDKRIGFCRSFYVWNKVRIPEGYIIISHVLDFFFSFQFLRMEVIMLNIPIK